MRRVFLSSFLVLSVLACSSQCVIAVTDSSGDEKEKARKQAARQLAPSRSSVGGEESYGDWGKVSSSKRSWRVPFTGLLDVPEASTVTMGCQRGPGGDIAPDCFLEEIERDCIDIISNTPLLPGELEEVQANLAARSVHPLSSSREFVLSEEETEEETRESEIALPRSLPLFVSDSDEEFKALFKNAWLIRPTTRPYTSEEEEERDESSTPFVEQVVGAPENGHLSVLIEDDQGEKESEWVVIKPSVEEHKPRMEVVLSEDNLEQPVDGLVPSKTWWEAFFGMDQEKAAIYQALYEEKEAIAAEMRLLQQKITLKRGKGNAVLMQAFVEATPEIDKKIKEIRLRAREVIRKAHKQAEILAELERQRLAEEEESSQKASEGGWLSGWWGTEQEQPDQEDEDYNFFPPEEKEEYTPTQTKLHKERVEGYIGTTDIGQWEDLTAAWFLQEGANHEFVVTTPPIRHPLEEVQTVALKKAQSFTSEEVQQIFVLHAIDCLTSGFFVGYWPQYLWDFLNVNYEACEVDTEGMSRLRTAREVYLTLSGYLLAEYPGYKWTEDEWHWFLAHQDKVYAWGTDAQISGNQLAELLESLQKNRDLHCYVCSALEQGVFVSDWSDEAWEWFQEYGLYETLGGSLIDQDTFDALQSLRNPQEDDM